MIIKKLSKSETELITNRRGTVRDDETIVNILGLNKEINTGLEPKIVEIQKTLNEVK